MNFLINLLNRCNLNIYANNFCASIMFSLVIFLKNEGEMWYKSVEKNFVTEVGPASVMVGNMVQGVRLASAQGRDIGVIDDDSDTARKYQFISEILKWRVTTTADHVIFTLFNAKVCCLNISIPLFPCET